MNAYIYISGIILQALAAIIALIEVRRAPRKLPWLLISISSLLIVARRASTLKEFANTGHELASAELLTLLITVLFLLGVILMSKMFGDFQKEHEELKQSEKRYMHALIGSKDGLYDWDLSNNKVIYSSGWKSMLGYSDDEIINNLSEWERLVHPDDKKKVLDEAYNFANGRIKELKIEMRMKHRDGHWVHVLSRGDIVRDRDKKPWRLIGTHVDITERKISEEALKKLSLYSRSLLEASLDPLVTISSAGIITDVNTASEKVTGVSRDKLIGSDFSDYFTDPVKAREGYLIAFENGLVKDYPLSIRHVDGKVTDVIYNASVYRDNDGSAAGVFAAARDISEQKKIEMELKNSRDMLESLWNVALISEYDMKTICDYILFEIVKMTSSMYGFYGFINNDESVMTIYSWSGDAMKDCSMVDKPADFKISESGVWAEAIPLRKTLIMNDYTSDHPAKKGCPEGHVPLTRLMVIPVFLQGKIVSVAAVANKESGYSEIDEKQITAFMSNIQIITNHRNAEDTIKALLNEKELLLREVHHRIKNNMNTIIGILSLHADRLKNPEILNVINDAENRIRSMMILYDKIYRHTDFRELPANEYFPSLVDEIISSFPNRNNVKVKIDMDEFELGVKILFPLGIIVNELLTNIMKYAFEGIDSGLITFSARKNENHVEFIIADNGVGIPENISLENSTGFGLQLAGMLISDVNGKISLDRSTGTKIFINFDL